MTMQPPDPGSQPPASGDPSTTPPTVTPPVQQSGGTLPGESWEERYKGLQRTYDKKIADMTAQFQALQQQYVAVVTQSEQLKKGVETANAAKTGLETTEADLRRQLSEVTAQRDSLTKQQHQHNLLLTTYPQIAQFGHFIPAAETDDQFLANAAAFAKTLEGYIDVGAQRLIQNATPPVSPNTSPPSRNENQGDILYNKVATLAGISGKEAEYEAALQEWIAYSEKK